MTQSYKIVYSKPSHEGFDHIKIVMKYVLTFLSLLSLSFRSHAQDNYEIQVYGAQTEAKGSTMFELHSNFTFGGQQYVQDGVLPTHNILHETLEITHGFTNWFETGFYFFNAIGSYNRTTYVGSHIRPRVMVPESWHWPVGISLSTEIGYQKPEYSADDWTLEIRPIIDKTCKKFYFSFNPAFEKSLHGQNEKTGFTFSPALKISYSVTKVVAFGLEYYGAIGTLSMPGPYQQQQHQLFLAIDLDVSKNWEFNAGYGLGFTGATDNDIFKVILGRRLHNKAKKQPNSN
jgi:outer membrane putative beta-barrel porin/alpha-amylase